MKAGRRTFIKNNVTQNPKFGIENHKLFFNFHIKLP